MYSLGHIALSVSNLDKSIAFYRDNFGLECAGIFPVEPAGLKIAILKNGSIALELFEFKDFKGLPEYRQELDSDLHTVGVKHFSLEVSEIQASYDALERSGVKFETELRTFEDGRKYFFLKDPDGILIEIMEEGR